MTKLVSKYYYPSVKQLRKFFYATLESYLRLLGIIKKCKTPTIERDRKRVFTDEKLGDSSFVHEQSTNRRLKSSPKLDGKKQELCELSLTVELKTSRLLNGCSNQLSYENNF